MKSLERTDRLELTALRATARDGITEILLGLLLITFGALFALETPLAALGALLPFALNPLGKMLKRRYVYPRTGYAKVAKKKGAARGIAMTAVVALAILVGVLGVSIWLLGRERGSSLWLSHFVPAVGGLLMAIGPWTIAWSYRLARWYVLALLFAFGGVAIPLLGIAEGYAAIALQSVIVGGLSFLFGMALFILFLRKTPRKDAIHVSP